MDKESISRLGLDYIANIDVDSSDEIYNPTNHNHTIVLKLIKQSNICCPHCGLVSSPKIRGSSCQLLKHSSANENNLIIKLKRRVFLCDYGRTFKEENPFTSSKRKTTLQKDYKILMTLKDKNKSFDDVSKDFNVSSQKDFAFFDKPRQLISPEGLFYRLIQQAGRTPTSVWQAPQQQSISP